MIRLGLVLPFDDHEREFLVRVIEQGEIAPELLTGDDELAARIRHSTDAVLVTLKLIVGPGDSGEPVITILLPDED